MPDLRTLWWRASAAPILWWHQLATWKRRRQWNAAADALLAQAPAEHWVPKDSPYCYAGWKQTPDGRPTSHGHCPFWHKAHDLPDQDNGYCALVREGDWQTGCGLIWDQVKICNINEPNYDDVDFLG